MNYIFSVSVVALMLLPAQAFADCTNPAAPTGKIIYNTTYDVFQGCAATGQWLAFSGSGQPGPQGPAGPPIVGDDTGPCTPEKSGKLRYDAGDTPPWQFCDGTDWVNFKQPQCADNAAGECYLDATRSTSDPEFVAANIADGVEILGVTGTLTAGLSGPSGCEDIGDQCADTTIFAGWHPVTHEQLFIPPTDQASSTWKTTVGANDIATDSFIDGRINTNQVPNSTTFPAFKECKDLGTGGHSDWYLPSRAELDHLANNISQLESGPMTDFDSSAYWSSTEYNTSNAWRQSFSSGYSVNTKNTALRLRCIRR